MPSASAQPVIEAPAGSVSGLDLDGVRAFKGIPYAAPLVELYGLRMSQLNDPEVRRNFEVFTRRGRSLSPIAQSFLDFIGPKIRAMPYLQ